MVLVFMSCLYRPSASKSVQHSPLFSSQTRQLNTPGSLAAEPSQEAKTLIFPFPVPWSHHDALLTRRLKPMQLSNLIMYTCHDFQFWEDCPWFIFLNLKLNKNVLGGRNNRKESCNNLKMHLPFYQRSGKSVS